MPKVLRFILDKSSRFHPRHKWPKKLSFSTSTPAVDHPSQLSKLQSSSSALAVDCPGQLPSSSSASSSALSIDRPNQVSPSSSDLELDRSNLLPPPSSAAQDTGFPNQSPSTSMPGHDRTEESLQHPSRGNPFLDLVTQPITPPTVAEESRKVAYTALKKILSALNDTSGMCPPLKTAVAGMLNILNIVDTYVRNKQGFQDLTQKLKALLSIVEDYEDRHLGRLLAPRMRDLSEAIHACLDDVNRRINKSRSRSVLEVDADASFVVGTFGKISLLLDAFQMDTQLHTNADVAQLLQDDAFRRLKPADNASYKSHRGRGSEFAGCMEDTRVNILEDLEKWADDNSAPKVCWLSGMAGIGKSSVAVTFSERMDKKLKLGASFFCSDSCHDARLIVPTIAYMLGRISPRIRSAICEVLESNFDVASDTLLEQFRCLLVQPIRDTTRESVERHKIVVIDAIDECTNLSTVESLIKAVLTIESDIPLKFLIAGRPEPQIRNTFLASPNVKVIQLHEIPKDNVQADIRRYLENSLSKLATDEPDWPPENDLSILLERSDQLFIYAATAMRYISEHGFDFKERLQQINALGTTRPTPSQTGQLDQLYNHIMSRAFPSGAEEWEVSRRQDVLSAVVCLETPLSKAGIACLLQTKQSTTHRDLSQFLSVIVVPSKDDGKVSIFHASFRDFIVDSGRCEAHVVDTIEGHHKLTVKCLECLNMLQRNICSLPEDNIGTQPHDIKDTHVIQEALRYSCLHWASHLALMLRKPLAAPPTLLRLLSTFVDEHLLHWFECLSALGELESGLKSLEKAREAISGLSKLEFDFAHIVLLLEDARRCLQMCFEPMQHHCLNVYHSALTWIPKNSLIRQQYAVLFRGTRVLTGLPESWGPIEHIMQHRDFVNSVAFSPDGCRVASASCDGTVRVWNTATGESERILDAPLYSVTSVVFSPDGSRIVSGSTDHTVRVWITATGESEHQLMLLFRVLSVAFSPDGKHVASGSAGIVQIWNTMTWTLEHTMEALQMKVVSVAFSSDGTRVMAGTCTLEIRIWNTTTGNLEHSLNGRARWAVSAIAFSPDGSRIALGCWDKTVRVWNTATEEADHVLKGHSGWVSSVAFSSNGSHIVSGSLDKKVRVWNTATGESEHVFGSHAGRVLSVAFSPDGKHVVSGSEDKTVRVWHMAAGESDHALDGHSDCVSFVAFSPDGNRVVSGSNDGQVRIWNTATGESEHVLKGHIGRVLFVVFSPDSKRVASGSRDRTIRVWNATTGELEHVLKCHNGRVSSIAFSPDGSRIVSGSDDEKVRVWNAATGESVHVVRGVRCKEMTVAFSPDGGHFMQSVEGHAGSWHRISVWDTVTGAYLCTDSEPRVIARAPHPDSDLRFSPDYMWILGESPMRTRWIAPEYRNIAAHAFFGSKVCFGCYTGCVVILDLDPVS